MTRFICRNVGELPYSERIFFYEKKHLFRNFGLDEKGFSDFIPIFFSPVSVLRVLFYSREF